MRDPFKDSEKHQKLMKRQETLVRSLISTAGKLSKVRQKLHRLNQAIVKDREEQSRANALAAAEHRLSSAARRPIANARELEIDPLSVKCPNHASVAVGEECPGVLAFCPERMRIAYLESQKDPKK